MGESGTIGDSKPHPMSIESHVEVIGAQLGMLAKQQTCSEKKILDKLDLVFTEIKTAQRGPCAAGLVHEEQIKAVAETVRELRDRPARTASTTATLLSSIVSVIAIVAAIIAVAAALKVKSGM